MTKYLAPNDDNLWGIIGQMQDDINRLKRATHLPGSSIDTDGLLTIKGSLLITGDLSVPDGSIDNEALTSPILPVVDYVIEHGFAITVAPVVRASLSIQIPEGYTGGFFIATTNLFAGNSGSGDYMQVIVCYSGPSGVTLSSSTGGMKYLDTNRAGTINSVLVDTIDASLTAGDMLTFWSEVGSGVIPYQADNGVETQVLVLFTR